MQTATHEIDVKLVKDATGSHAVPQNIPQVMHPGETVHYRPLNTNGEVTIEFSDVSTSSVPPGLRSPFLDPNGNGQEKTEISSKEGPITVTNLGIFFCRCFITEPGKDKVGWGPNSLQSGGNHEVK
jgi:hypothetical protein